MEKQPSTGDSINTLDSIVTKLQWAAVGKSDSITSGVDIDKYVSELILEEAKKSNKLYNKLGLRAYLDPTTGSKPCNLRKTNKTFLRNIVKNTNCHNKIIERASEHTAIKLQHSHKNPSKHSRGKTRNGSISPDRKYRSIHLSNEQERSSKRQRYHLTDKPKSDSNYRPK